MPHSQIDESRARHRLRLRVAAKLMVAAGVAVLAYAFLASFFHGDDRAGTIPAKRVAVAHLTRGEVLQLVWAGRPVLVHRRTQDQQAQLSADTDTQALMLRDPTSAESTQPAAAANRWRSIDPEWFVVIGAGTDFSCPVRFQAADGTRFLDTTWRGGFVDSCRGSRYDLAGRVFRDQYADRNLPIPSYRVEPGMIILGDSSSP